MYNAKGGQILDSRQKNEGIDRTFGGTQSTRMVARWGESEARAREWREEAPKENGLLPSNFTCHRTPGARTSCYRSLSSLVVPGEAGSSKVSDEDTIENAAMQSDKLIFHSGG